MKNIAEIPNQEKLPVIGFVGARFAGTDTLVANGSGVSWESIYFSIKNGGFSMPLLGKKSQELLKQYSIGDEQGVNTYFYGDNELKEYRGIEPLEFLKGIEGELKVVSSVELTQEKSTKLLDNTEDI